MFLIHWILRECCQWIDWLYTMMMLWFLTPRTKTTIVGCSGGTTIQNYCHSNKGDQYIARNNLACVVYGLYHDIRNQHHQKVRVADAGLVFQQPRISFGESPAPSATQPKAMATFACVGVRVDFDMS